MKSLHWLHYWAIRGFVAVGFLTLATFVASGCKSSASQPTASASPAEASRPTIRIKCGVTEAYTDPDGVVWAADQGFDGGDTVARDADLAISNTKDPAMYRTERFEMAGYSFTVPNGKYKVKLHFAETYEGITGPGLRVFSYSVQGQTVKDFDMWAKIGPNKADIESFDVDVTDGKLNITFTPNIENPEINAIEIIPE